MKIDRVKYQESLMHRRRKKKKRRSHRTSRAGTEKHMTADDLLLGDTAVNGDFGRRRNRAGRDEVVSYGSGPVIIGEELEPDEKLDKLHGFSSYNGERRKSRQPGVYGQGFGERLGELPVRSRTKVTADPRDSELEKDMREMEERRAGISGNTTNATNSRIRIVPIGEEENDKKDKPRRSRVEIQPQEQDEIVVFEEHDSPDERTNRRSRLGARDRARSTARTIDTWERSEVGESTIFTPTPRNRSRGRSGLGERDLKSPGVSVRERELSVPRSVDSWERSDIESTVLTQREREKSRTPKSRGARARSTARTIDTWERSEVGASTVMSGGRTPGTRSGVSARARERSRVDRERERERERVEKERERERDSGYEGEGERWHGRGYNYDERKRGHSPVPSRLGESRRDRQRWSERGSGMSTGAKSQGV